MTPTRSASGRRFLLVALAAVGIAGVGGWAVGTFRTGRHEPPAGEPAVSAAAGERRGELVFGVYCASCHGPDGRGDGPSAATLRPPPRDFAARPWRFAVTRESIRKVTLDGIPGTPMASNRSAIAPADLEPLVEYVYGLATSRPVTHEPTEEDTLLGEAGFLDLRGTAPPALVVEDAAGKEVKLSDLKGRLVLLHFWGTGCVHCLKEMPRLKTLEAELGERRFVALHVCTDADDVKDAQVRVDHIVPGLRVFTDASGLAPARFEVQSLPTVWLLAPDGKAVGRSHGARDWTAPPLRRLLEHWLPPPTSP